MKSSDYNKFTFYKDNRDIQPSLVKKLMLSMEDIGYVEAKPILVEKIDNDFFVVDGQHRFLACQELSLPIVYQYLEGDRHETMLKLNQNQSNWQLKDYIKLHATNLKECYIKLAQFQNRYKLSWTSSIYIVFNGDAGAKKIRDGVELPINKNRDEIYKFLLECKPFLKFWNNHKFVRAIVEVYKRANPKDIERLRDKVMLVKQMNSTVEYLQIFEHLINKGKSKQIQIVPR